MSMVPGVGILTFPSKAEMRSTFVTSDSPAEVKAGCSMGVGGSGAGMSREQGARPFGVDLVASQLRLLLT